MIGAGAAPGAPGDEPARSAAIAGAWQQVVSSMNAASVAFFIGLAFGVAFAAGRDRKEPYQSKGLPLISFRCSVPNPLDDFDFPALT